MKPTDTQRQLQQHSNTFRKVERQLTNIEQRIGFLEVKMEANNKLQASGNGTRNLMLGAVVLKLLTDGLHNIDLTTLMQLLRG